MAGSTRSLSLPEVPGYESLRRIGAGGMGEVFLASRSTDRTPVAIKFVSSDQPHRRTEDEQRFEREIRVMSETSHPNIVRVLDHGILEDRRYLVMEYVDGESLGERLQLGGPLRQVSESQQIISGISQALQHLHDLGIVHRDLKPDNVIIDREGQVKLLDFGIAAPIAELGELTVTGEFLGSLDYVAPEQRSRLVVDERADQFALAVIAYQLLTGKKPLGRFKLPSQLNRELGCEVDLVVSRALEEDPDDRYPTVREFLSALEESFDAVSVLGGESSTTLERTTYYVELARRNDSLGRMEEAIEALTEAVRLEPQVAALRIDRAILFKKHGLYQRALDDLDEALRLEPELADAYVGMGSVYVKLKDYDTAIEQLNRAIEADSGCALAYAWRGWAYHGLEDDFRALDDLDQAIRLDKGCGVAYQFRGILAKLSHDYRGAIRDASQFAFCEPRNPYAHRTLARLLTKSPDVELRDGERAVRHAREACELTRWQSWAALEDLAGAVHLNGDGDSASRYCEQAIELAPENTHQRLREKSELYRTNKRERPAT